MNDFLQNASAFNCGLIAFEKLDIGWVPTARFLWQQPHYAKARNMQPWLNWSSDWLRSRLAANWPSLIGPLTSGENDSRPASRLRDSILNSCCNVYFHLSFVVCINSRVLMIETSRCNHVNCNDCMAHFNFNAVVITLCMSYNIFI